MRYGVDPARVQWRVVDGEAVLVDVESTYYYGLNRTGTFVWSLLAERAMSRDEIVRRVAAEYGRPPADVAGDVVALLTDLVRERLVEER
jgi:outer membrane protein assembly factor BamB